MREMNSSSPRRLSGKCAPLALLLAVLWLGGCDDDALRQLTEAGVVITDAMIDARVDLPCGPEATRCGNVCVNLNVDDQNCGTCGNQCKPGQICAAANCITSCQGGLTRCTGKCVNTNKDRYNCGACGNVCKPGEVCSAGKCTKECQQGLTDCAGVCSNTQIDPDNCGACGTKCKAGEVCAAGKCVAGQCPAPLSTCGGGDAGVKYCANLTNDPQNCGACATACTTAHICSKSKCALVCATGLFQCGGGDAGAPYCADLNGDNTNCGACGNKCNAGESCSAGTCVLTCPAGSVQCAGASGTIYCADLFTDQKNCGKCGTACGAGAFCLNGKCALSCPSSMTMCFSGAPVYYDAGVPDLGPPDGGGAADQGAADAGPADAAAPDMALDAGASTDLDAGAAADKGPPAKYPYCANLTTDNDNCGKCGDKCPAGYVCSNGKCGFTCHASHTQCGGGDSGAAPTCANLQTDFHNCGKCGNKCFLAQVCKAGTCTLFCPGGLTDCSGICVNLQYDDANCGKCNSACTPKTHACYQGTCQTKCQGYGEIRCGGSCVKAKTDPKNCGVCGNTCASGEVCKNGGCTCLAGATKCPGGCALLASDPKNCGACGTVCPAATPYCAQSKCTATAPSCKAMLAATPGAKSGVYTISPAAAAAPFKVYCDMTTDGGGWTLAARFSNKDGTQWIDSAKYWYDRTTEVGAPTVRGTNADALSAAFWTVLADEFKLARTDATTDAHLLKTNAKCLGGKTFRTKVTGFGNYRTGAWASSAVRGTCAADLASGATSTSGFKYATCSSSIGKPKSVSFFADWSSGDGAVMMIGGGGSCSRADHGIAITEANDAQFGTSCSGCSSRKDFGDESSSGSTSYGINLFVR